VVAVVAVIAVVAVVAVHCSQGIDLASKSEAYN